MLYKNILCDNVIICIVEAPQMGCSISHNSAVVFDISENRNQLNEVPSMNNLHTLLRESFFRQNLRNFILNTWIPINKENNDFYRSEAKGIAINFLDFCLDAQDYSLIPKSAFQSFRACFMFEKYLMHGASRHVPITTNVTDECAEILFGATIVPQEVDSALYMAAMQESVEFLAAEVLPAYSRLPTGGSESKKLVLEMVLGINGASLRRRGSLHNSPDKNAITCIMNKIFSEKVYFNTFKEYLKETDSANLLLAYVDLKQVEEKLLNMPVYADGEVKACTTLHFLNAFYDTYIALGATSRVPMSEATYGDCLRKLSHITGIEVSSVLI